jgi:hypothetical protein
VVSLPAPGAIRLVDPPTAGHYAPIGFQSTLPAKVPALWHISSQRFLSRLEEQRQRCAARLWGRGVGYDARAAPVVSIGVGVIAGAGVPSVSCMKTLRRQSFQAPTASGAGAGRRRVVADRRLRMLLTACSLPSTGAIAR